MAIPFSRGATWISLSSPLPSLSVVPNRQSTGFGSSIATLLLSPTKPCSPTETTNADFTPVGSFARPRVAVFAVRDVACSGRSVGRIDGRRSRWMQPRDLTPASFPRVTGRCREGLERDWMLFELRSGLRTPTRHDSSRATGHPVTSPRARWAAYRKTASVRSYPGHDICLHT